ncbi:predicted protein [Plenodomus lingam JN3]|uniref:Predicted protein n=1 Tax=Leptosphaeria maculans (strain JN3 / isolate v23.1.3 / race Av1-4-5-6-7-8) TaxID=985895 RepID=E5AAP0_LEPMJ|nr:predicted protein [Plenodomus lingam JN3]CBY00731.1 predicted protein [Plenodomus lingam JN3]
MMAPPPPTPLSATFELEHKRAVAARIAKYIGTMIQSGRTLDSR